MLAGLDYAHIVKISQGELDFLGGDVKALWRDPTNLIVVTDGESGAIAYSHAGETVAPGHLIEPVDTTGAGDGFVAGLLVKILEHPDDYLTQLKSILCFANAVGALTCTQRGAIPALPARAQVEAFADCD
jgi:fructokinase